MIEVLSPGPLTTIQDLGRPGFAHLGVSAAGAADTLALRVANRLAGNPETAAGLEMTLMGGRFRFHQACTIALCGGAFESNIALWTSVPIQPGFELEVGGSRSGVRVYLAVNGGLITPKVLGSASVHLLSGFGTQVKRGDRLETGVPQMVTRNATGPYAYRTALRITAGAGTEDFQPGAWESLIGESWTVADQSNRQGIRLSGSGPIPSPGGGAMESEGVALGAIQIPASGEPIILFVDSQTTGGYPVLANIASVDLPNVAQLRPRDAVTFEPVSFAVARRLLLEQEAWIQSVG